MVEHGALRRVAPRAAAQRAWPAVAPRLFRPLFAGGGTAQRAVLYHFLFTGSTFELQSTGMPEGNAEE